MVFRKVISV